MLIGRVSKQMIIYPRSTFTHDFPYFRWKARVIIEVLIYRKTSDRSPRLLLVQFTLTPGLYPGPGV